MKDTVKRKITRKNGKHLRVPVLPEEEEIITRNAKITGLPVATFLRNLGMGYEVRGVLDHARINDLAKVNGDMGRLGGLLKLWLTDDPRTTQFSTATIRLLLVKIENTQDEMREIIKGVVHEKF